MNIIDYFNSPVCVRFALALVHFLWQGLVIALLAVSLASLFGKNSSKTRYGVYVISLFAMVLSLGVTYALVDVSSTQVEYAQHRTEITPSRLEPTVAGSEAGLPSMPARQSITATAVSA